MKQKLYQLITALLTAILICSTASAADKTISIEVKSINENGVAQSIGTVVASESPYGILFTPNLKDLPPGLRGFHIHQNPNCEPGEQDGKQVAGLSAGGHYDPEHSEAHHGPYHDGHLGDLPPLVVAANGTATLPVLAPRLKFADIKGRSLMIHAGGDNFSDTPEKLGGGGARVACGIIQ